MRVVSIGDIHGHSSWKAVIEKEKGADKIVFVGDYVDSFTIDYKEQIANLLDIIDLKIRNPDKVVLLIGNHDHHYWPEVGDSGTSGYQEKYAHYYELIFDAHQDLFQMCYKDDFDNVYSHAGFSTGFMQLIGAYGSHKFEYINELLHTNPKVFNYYPGDRGGYGEHPLQSCIWIRPSTLAGCTIDNVQVVGHTTVNNINHPAKSERRGFYLIDCMHNKQYLSCTDGVFNIEKYV